MEARRERKVVTVLFADLVGFTARAEQLDPEDVEAILRPYHERLRHELERYGGTVEKFIGDAVMALYGAPVAHEDDPERAVRAALAIRDWIRDDGDLEARIAIVTGEALVSLAARPELGEGMAAGDVVNTAARLQAAAPVNGIIVGETTYRATRHAIDYRAAEPVGAKGKSEPIVVWEALQARARPAVESFETAVPLVGRRRELDLLTDALARARQERTSQLVTLVGVPGIGKSRLVYELNGAVEADPDLITWRQGRSLPYGEGVTYWALSEMVKAQAGILESDPAAEAEEKLRETVAELVPEAEAASVLAQLRPLVGISADGEGAADHRADSFAGWRRFLEALAERRPTVLVFDDLHWADDGLLDFVDHLADWATGVPLLVVGTARPELFERRSGWGGGKPNALTLSLSPLSDEETSRLLATLLDRALLPAETQSALLANAGGNPLYAEQFARMLAESGAEAELPETVQGIIAARLDALPAEEKTLMQDAAVLGKVFWAGALAHVADVGRGELEQSLHRLERKEFVRRERRSSVADETEYAFRHVLVREVAYGQIPRAERADRHLRAAQWLESLGRLEDHAEMLAHHYLSALELGRAAGRSVEEVAAPARQALTIAGDRAAALNAFAAAAAFYRAAYDLWPPGTPERPQALYRYARALYWSEGRGYEQLEAARDGLVARGDIETAAEAEILMAEILWKLQGRREPAERHLGRARELVQDRPPSRAKVYVTANLSRFRMIAEETEEAIRFGREALAMAEAIDLPDLQAAALDNIGVCRAQEGDLDGGIADLERAIELSKGVSLVEHVRALINLASIFGNWGDMRRAFELHDDGARIAQEYGTLGGETRWLESERAIDLYHLGRWDEAVPDLDRFIDEAGSSPHYMAFSCLVYRAQIRFARGADEAPILDDLRRAVELAREIHDPQAVFPALMTHARICTLTGGVEEAEASVRELTQLLEAGETTIPSAWVSDLALVLRALGRDRLPAALESFPRTAWFEAAEAILAGRLGHAADSLREIGSLPDEAFVRLRAAEARVAEGRRAAADTQLHAALAFYRSVGAARFVREGEALLAASA